MHPSLEKIISQHGELLDCNRPGVSALVTALDAACYELEFTSGGANGESEGIASLLLERVPAIIYAAEFGPVSKCFYASPQIRDILGFEPTDWTNDPGFWFDHVHPEDRDRAIDADEHTKNTGDPLRVEYRMIARDGRVVTVRAPLWMPQSSRVLVRSRFPLVQSNSSNGM